MLGWLYSSVVWYLLIFIFLESFSSIKRYRLVVLILVNIFYSVLYIV